MYRIAGPWRGRLCIIPRPRGGDWLEDDIRAWKDSGLEVVVSLLEESEMTALDLSKESHWCKASGIEFRVFPITDRGVPTSMAASTFFFEKLKAELEQGKSIAIHCRQGIGRSALVAACLLILAGVHPDAAVGQIAVARRTDVPETAAQREWIEQFALRNSPVVHPVK